MRNYIVLLAAAPLTLLAACGGNDADDPATATGNSTDVPTNYPSVASEQYSGGDYVPGPATRLSDAGDISGGYTYTGADGTSRSVRIDANDKSYTYYGPDGSQQTGNYSWSPDGYRLMLPDMDGQQVSFAVREGSLVRLNDDKKMSPDTNVEGEPYMRDDDSAMFSREPELGSPVAPQN